MVKIYTGTPGSGKSYHAAKDIYTKLRAGKNVVSTMAIDFNIVRKGKKKTGIYEFVFIQELTPKYLIEFAERHHRIGKEGQSIVVIDECHIIFNSRDYSANGRKEWLLFFAVHRHYGFDIILITQNDRQVDRQIRAQVENEYKHRKINNFGMLILLPVKVFAVIEYWYVNKTKVGSYFIKFKRSVAKIYNSYEANNVIAEKLGVKKAPGVSSAAVEAVKAIPSPGGAEAGRGVAGGPCRSGGRVWGWFTKELLTATVK